MKPIGLRIPLSFRLIVFIGLAVSWFSGVGFFILDTFFQVQHDYSISSHPWLTPAMTIHGASAFVMMLAYGALLGAHVPAGWKTHRLRYWGLSLVSALGLQVFTAYLLYYLGGELSRDIVKWVHLVVGATLPLILTGHILAGRKAQRNRQKQK